MKAIIQNAVYHEGILECAYIGGLNLDPCEVAALFKFNNEVFYLFEKKEIKLNKYQDIQFELDLNSKKKFKN